MKALVYNGPGRKAWEEVERTGVSGFLSRHRSLSRAVRKGDPAHTDVAAPTDDRELATDTSLNMYSAVNSSR
jgi:hypothetical protein